MKLKLKDYLRAFVIGSNALVFIPFFIVVRYLKDKRFKDVTPYGYTVPLYFGFMTMFSLFLSSVFNISFKKSLFIVSQISALFVSVYITLRKTYNFRSRSRWYLQYLYVYIAHVFTYLFTIHSLMQIII